MLRKLRPLILCALALTTLGLADGPPPLNDPFLDALAGRWTLEGTVMGEKVVNTVDAQWVLGHQFLRLHLEDVAEPPSYEALIFLGREAKTGRYTAHWLDVAGAGPSKVLGSGNRTGDTLVLLFDYPGATFRDTFTLDPKTGTWTLLIESRPGAKPWSTFASYSARRTASSGLGSVIETNYAEVANANGQPFSVLFVSSETPILNTLSSEARAQWQSDVTVAESAFASGDHRQLAITLKPMLQFLSSEPKVSRTWLDVAFADGHQVRIEQMIELKPSQHPSEGMVAWKMQDLSSGKTIVYATWDPASASHYSADGEALASSVLASASTVVAMPHAVSGGECQEVLLQGPARASFGCLTSDHFNDAPAAVVSSMLNSFPPNAAGRLNLALTLVQGVSAESVTFATDDGVLPLADPLVPVFTIPGTPVGDHLTITKIEGEDELPTLDAPSSAIVGLFPGKPGWRPVDPNAATTDRLNTFFAIGN